MGVGMSDDIDRLLTRVQAVSIGVLTEDFSKIHDLIAVAKEIGPRIVVIGKDDPPPGDLDCILIDETGSFQMDEIISTRIVEMMDDPEGSILRAIAVAMDAISPTILVAGIDPGKRPGLAFLADGRLVSIYKSSASEDAVKRVLLMKRALQPEGLLVRLGDGDPLNRDVELNELFKAGLSVEIVDESMTTTSRRFRDETSAVAIAITPGSPVINKDI